MMKRLLVLLGLLLSTLCISRPPIEGELRITLDVPSQVYADEEIRVYLDLDNRGNRTFKIDVAEFFDTDGFEKLSTCSRTNFILRPNGYESVECRLRYVSTPVPAEAKISARVEYSTNLTLVAPILLLTEEEYEKRRIAGTVGGLKERYSVSDGTMRVELELRANPILMRGKEEYVYLSLENLGDGIPENMRIDVQGTTPSGILTCPSGEIRSIGGKIEKVVCTIDVAAARDRTYLNLLAKIQLNYDYKVRKTATVSVIR